MAINEKRADTVAIPRQAATVVASLITAALIGLGSFIFRAADRVDGLNQQIEHMRQVEQIRHEAVALEINRLEQFANKGEHFTHEDGKRHAEWIRELQQSTRAHEIWGKELVGRWNEVLQSHGKRISTLELEQKRRFGNGMND